MSFDNFPWLAFVLAILFNIILGFVWYAKSTPTGRLWMRHQGMDPDDLPKMPGSAMAMSMGLMLVGVVLMMFVFVHTNTVYEDAFGNPATGGKLGYELTVADGLTGAFFTWLGFIVPMNLNAVAFERKPWSLFWVNAGYYLVALLMAGLLVALV